MQSKARGRILLATDRLATEMPLHAGILAQWRLSEDTTINTMAIGYHRGRLLLSFNPLFVENISLDQTAAVLCHEINHVLLGHCTHLPVDGENERAMTIAEEVTANEWIAGPLPCKPILLSDYEELPPNEDTQTRYERLKTIVPDVRETLDDHGRWNEIVKSELGRVVMSSVIASVWKRLSPEQKSKITLPEAAKQVIVNAVKSSGSSVIGNGVATVPWQKVLRKYVGRTLLRRPVFGRVPRRYPHLVGIVPATGRSTSLPKIVFCLDTSGSMTTSILSDFSAEMSVLAKSYDLTVIEADTMVRAVYKFRPLNNVMGRGGTDFRPALEEAARMRPDLVIYGTDGRGKAPLEASRFPVIWLITGNGRKPVSWGREIRIS